MKNEFDSVVVHYAEIGLKGKNRTYFENLLINNIKTKLGKLADSCIRESGQITINLAKRANLSKVKDIVSRIPGIAYFSFSIRCGLDIKQIKKAAFDSLKDKNFKTFKVDSERRDKSIKPDSMGLNCLLGEEIIKKYNKKVKMKEPDLLLKIERTSTHAYISFQNIGGVGGLPTNQKQKVVALLSGGFDSPVASYLMMKRGCEVILVHFQNRNQMTASVQNKIESLAKQLSRYQIKTKLYIVPFEKIQKQIIANAHSTLRMLVYRRFMIKIASKIAQLEKARFLVVGDSLSQVASQTLENLEATYYSSEKHILSPLIGVDKKEIMDIAKRIGTYDISALAYGDCCSYFLPKHPELKATKGLLEKIESGFEVEDLVKEAVGKVRIKEW